MSLLLQVVGAAEAHRLGVYTHMDDRELARCERAIEGRTTVEEVLRVVSS